MVKNPLAMQETQVSSLGQKDPPEIEMATHSNVLIWEIPQTEEPDSLQSLGLQRVRHDLTLNNNKINTNVLCLCISMIAIEQILARSVFCD